MDDPYRPTIHSQADLEAVWSRLMGPWGFGRRSIWMLRVDDDRNVVPSVVEIAECEDRPEPDLADRLAGVLSELCRDDVGGSFAFLISRPGRAAVQDDDRAWARMLL